MRRWQRQYLCGKWCDRLEESLLSDLIYWVWLQKALGFASPKIKSVIELYQNPKNFYEAGRTDWIMTGLFNKSSLEKIANIKLSEAKKIIENCDMKNQRIVTFNSDEYPDRLKTIYAPPCLLYVKGKIPDVDNKISISIVGTRSATKYGMSMAFDFAFNLAKSEAIVISGGAIGVDITAHRGALMAKGKCICVLGCGLDYNYLHQNLATRELIAQNGALITEFPPGSPPSKYNFPMRNRIMAGLSSGVLVIEAGEKSGSLITARYAADEGRDVFAMPGNAKSLVSMGANNLIKEGAKLVTNPKEILEEYMGEAEIRNLPLDFGENNDNLYEKNINSNHIVKTAKIKEKTCGGSSTSKKNIQKPLDSQSKSETQKINLSEHAKTLLNFLGTEAKHIDQISFESGLSTIQSLAAITELELAGLICSCPGKRYKLPKK